MTSPIERMIDEACGVTVPAETVAPRYAVLDTIDNAWLGVNPEGTGPKVYDDFEVAAFAAEMVRRLLGYPVDRLMVERYTSHGEQLAPNTFTAEVDDVFDAMEADGLITDAVVQSLTGECAA